ncbi:helicase [Aureococcus anophagefferens]|nr:helicase [Aureococcus anophagefferens]
MSRAAHDAVRSHLDLGGEEVSAGAAAQLVRECKTDRQAAAALAAAHDGVVRAGFSAADASRALACVAARRGACASPRRTLDWLCLRLDHGSLPRAFREDDEDERKGPDTSHVTLDIAAEDEAADAADDDGGAADRKAFALRYAAQLAEAEVAEARRGGQGRSAAWGALPRTKRRRLERELEALRARHRKLKRTKLKHATCDKKTAVRDEAADIGDTIAGIVASSRLPPPPPKHKKQLAPRASTTARRTRRRPRRPSTTRASSRATRRRRADAATSAGAGAGDDDDAVGDLFAAAEAAAAVAPPVEHAPAAPARAVEPAVVWSGATPREKLDQWCRERGNPKPQYEVASKATLRCRVWAPQRERIQKKNARKAKGCAAVGPPTLVAGQDKRAKFPTSKPHISAVFHSFRLNFGRAIISRNGSSRRRTSATRCSTLGAEPRVPRGASGAGRDFAATKALYALSPELPLYRVLPRRSGLVARPARGRARDAENAISAEARQQLTDKKLDDVLQQTKAGDEWKAWWLARKRSKGYSAMRETRSALPAAKSRDAFVDAAAFAASPRHADGIVVCGETGSGKTTQLPHFILDSELCAGGLRASDVRIIVTQPRRVAATSVARRVAEECGEDDVGGLVGYHIRHERRVSSRTKLLFCTAGVLLRMLRGFSDDGDGGDGDDGDAFVRGATHIILDEVHERAADSDLLLAALRRALFQKYLDTGTGKAATPTPVLSISGRAHPVAEYFLEDVVAAAGHRHDFGGAAGFAESGPGPSVRVARRDGGDDGRLERAMARYRDEEAEPHSGTRLDTSSSREHYDCRLADHQEPELMRVPLEELLLSVKLACDDARATSSTFFGSAAEWLGECPQPPPTHALSAALSELVSVGALAHAVEGEDDSWAAMEASLGAGSTSPRSPLGRHLARLPVHPRLGKMLVYGTLFGCVGPAASVAAAVGAAGADALRAGGRGRKGARARAAARGPRRRGPRLDAYRGEPGQQGRAALARELGLHEPAVREALDARQLRGALRRGSSTAARRAGATRRRTATRPTRTRRWDTNRSKLLLGGCAVATPFALLLMYPGDLEVRHAAREATLANWMTLTKVPARTAVLLRELRKQLGSTIQALFEAPAANSDEAAAATIDVVARLLAEEPTRAILGE